MTPFHMAVYYQHIEVVKFFIGKGFNVNLRRNDNAIALHDAATNGNMELIELLLEHNSDLEERTIEFGVTPFLAALYSDQEKVALYLLKRGADPWVRSKLGPNAFKIAKDYNYVEVLNFLKRIYEVPPADWTTLDVMSWIYQLVSENLFPLTAVPNFKRMKYTGKDLLEKSNQELEREVGLEPRFASEIKTLLQKKQQAFSSFSILNYLNINFDFEEIVRYFVRIFIDH